MTILQNEGLMIKDFSLENQSQIVDLILSIQQNEYNIQVTKQDQPDLFDVRDFYQNGTGNFWVAMHADQVVGTIALLDIGHHQVALRKMFVAQPFRGKVWNTAGLLLQTAFLWAKEKSVKEIYLGTTVQFVAAHRFYEKNGFCSVEPGELPVNFPVMKVDKLFYRYIV